MSLFLTFVVCMVVCCNVLHAQTYNFTAVDKILEDSLAVLGGTGPDDAGGVCLLIHKDGKLIYDRSIALPGKNMSKTRLLPIASASKWVSGAVITALLDRNILSLDHTLSQYFPSVSEEKRGITLRQLFTFTAGFRSNLGPITPCVEDITSTITLAECVDSVLSGKLTTLPGSTLNYGSEGMHVAGRMAEIAFNNMLPSGNCWDSVFTETIARNLEWTRTSWDVRGLYNTDNPRIDGGVLSTAEEYLKLLVMILNRGVYNGRRVIGAEWIDTMLADQTQGARISYTPYLGMEALFPGVSSTRYGIGLWRERVDPVTDTLLEGASQGRFGYSPWIDFQRGYCAVLALKSNSVTSVYPSYMKLKQAIRDVLDATTSVSFADDSAEWRTIGTYDVLGRAVDNNATGALFVVEQCKTSIRCRTMYR